MNTARSTEYIRIFIVALVFLMLFTLVVPSATLGQALDVQSVGSQPADKEIVTAGESIQSINVAG